MRIQYVGPLGSGVEVDLPDGPTVRIAHSEVVTLPDEFARGLLAQGEEHWRLVSHFGERAEFERLPGVHPSELVRMTLRRQRSLRGWTQKQLAERLAKSGYPRSQTDVSRLESGERGLSVDDLVALACALNVSPVRLLEGAFLDSPPDVAVTSGVVVPYRRFRSWLRGGKPLPADKDWRADSEEPWSGAYYRAVSDEDWLERQRVTVRMLVDACRALVEVADEYREHVPEAGRASFDNALDKVGRELDALDKSQTEFPSQRPGRQERRGRPRGRRR